MMYIRTVAGRLIAGVIWQSARPSDLAYRHALIAVAAIALLGGPATIAPLSSNMPQHLAPMPFFASARQLPFISVSMS